MQESRAARYAYYGVPMLFCLAAHGLALQTWFSADDFAWLGLPLEIHGWHDFLDVLFGPRAQGTIRTLSERVYFLVFTEAFGLNALPFRLWAFLTQLFNIVLVMQITRRLTGSRLAAFLAPILWCANAGLAVSLDWSSAYNEICCSFFILLAFWLFLRFIDTGQRKYWIAQWVVFLLGFGALELNVMYPALVFAYCLCCARDQLRRVVWLFIPSALFTAFHFLYVPQSHDPNYSMHFSAAILKTLWSYWGFALGALRPELVDWRPLWLGLTITLLITAALVAFTVRRRGPALFLLAWFFIMMAPLAPLTNHFSEYYLTIPMIGVAMLGGWATAQNRWLALPLVALYLTVSIADLYSADRYFYRRARLMKRLVKGLEAERSKVQGKAIVLSGVDNDLFWSGFFDDPFRLLGIREIYLAPGGEKGIDKHPEWGGIDRFVTSLDKVAALLHEHRAVAFAVNSNGIVDITKSYQQVVEAQFASEHRDFADAGDPVYASRLGAGWYPIENGYRWTAKRAVVHLGGPQQAGEHLFVDGYCPAPVLADGPVELTVSADGRKLGSASLSKPGESFELQFPAPAELVGKYDVEVAVEVNHTITPPSDPRPMGLTFGTFRMK
jgi:hypothetical protein